MLSTHMGHPAEHSAAFISGLVAVFHIQFWLYVAFNDTSPHFDLGTCTHFIGRNQFEISVKLCFYKRVTSERFDVK